MLDALRKGASGWVAQLFIAVLVISFAIWGVADVFRGFRADTVATVGKADIKGKEAAFTVTSENEIEAQAVVRALRDAGFNAKIAK